MNNPSTPHIDIQVKTLYIAEQSNPADSQYMFMYTIVINNQGDCAAKLLTRHWIITDSDGQVQEVKGEGVVGEQPYLKPGEKFEYSSGAVISTPVGTMQGSYQMVTDNGEVFEAPIKPFSLAVPNILH